MFLTLASLPKTDDFPLLTINDHFQVRNVRDRYYQSQLLSSLQNLKAQGNMLDEVALESVAQNPRAISDRFRRQKLGYAITNLAIGPAFTAFNTYAAYQLQGIAFTIGHAPDMPAGTGCPPDAIACRVPFGSGDINYLSLFNYITAICYAISGAMTLFISGVGDRMGYQREQYIFLLCVYGILCLPFAALTSIDLHTFNVYAGLYVAFNTVGFLAGAWGKVFIPLLMYQAEESPLDVVITSERMRGKTLAEDSQANEGNAFARIKREASGLSMSLWGSNALSIGQILILLIAIGVSYASDLFAGLYVTTAAGAFCIIASLAATPMLPSPRPDAKAANMSAFDWIKLPFQTFIDFFVGLKKYPEAFKLLIAYTIYNDALFAFGTVSNNLFLLNVRPELREYTAYSMIQPIVAIVGPTILVLLYHPAQRLSLLHIIVTSIAVGIFVTVWCCIGMSDASLIGFKNRWEFYVMSVLLNMTSGIFNVTFSPLFAQLFPRGHEIEFFGFQLVLSLGTVWIPQVVNGPIVDATNNLRLPAVISVVTFIIALGFIMATDMDKGIRQVEITSKEATTKVQDAAGPTS